MFFRRTRCYSFRKDKIWKKYDSVLVVCFENRHHHFIDFFLNALKMNQNKIIQKLNANVNLCILNDEIIIATLLNEIKTKTYIHILTSSKLALFNVFFKKILQIFEFCDRICLVVIDETHLMKDWFN